MTLTETDQLRRFLGADAEGAGFGLFLPQFEGSVALRAESPGPFAGAPEPLTYPGHTFSERDARAAFYVLGLFGQAVGDDRIEVGDASRFSPEAGLKPTTFLFGSRSNQATPWATRPPALGKFFDFTFGPEWSIRCKDGTAYSLPDPSRLDAASYVGKTDYGVIGRFYSAETKAHVFLVAGLGSRATEGCGYYLARHWRELDRKYPSGDFAVVLKFPPPLDPKTSEAVRWFGAARA
jgi:hypothetical protein